MNEAAAQLIGMGVVMSIGFMALYIAGDATRWRMYGRSALIAFGFYQLLFFSTRALVFSGAIERSTQSYWNTVGAFVFLTVLINLHIVRRVQLWLEEGRKHHPEGEQA